MLGDGVVSFGSGANWFVHLLARRGGSAVLDLQGGGGLCPGTKSSWLVLSIRCDGKPSGRREETLLLKEVGFVYCRENLLPVLLLERVVFLSQVPPGPFSVERERDTAVWRTWEGGWPLPPRLSSHVPPFLVLPLALADVDVTCCVCCAGKKE